MLINGTPISAYGVVDSSYEFGEPNVITYDNWMKGAPHPIFYNQDVQYSMCVIEAYMQHTTREALENNISNLTRAFNRCVVSFTSISGTFEGYLTARNIEKLTAFSVRVTFTLQGRRLAAQNSQIITTFTESTIFNVEGNSDIPLTMKLNTNSAVEFVYIWINGHIYSFENLEANKTYVLDTEIGRFYELNGSTETNCIDKFGGYELPFLIGGDNSIRFSSGASGFASVEVIWKGRWQ